MQMRARSEAKMILRVFRLGCAIVDMVARKFSHNVQHNESQPDGGYKRDVLLFRTEDEPNEFGVEEQDGSRNNPGDDLDNSRIDELTHLGTVAGKLDQRDHCERQLKAENHLAENEQRSNFVLARKTNDQCSRNDGDGTHDKPAQPRLEANVEKAFHDDLAGQRAGQRGVLAGGEQRASEERAGEAHSKDGAEELVGVGDFRDVVEAAGMESSGAKNQNCG